LNLKYFDAIDVELSNLTIAFECKWIKKILVISDYLNVKSGGLAIFLIAEIVFQQILKLIL
jgi:hypothetical protein